MINEYQNPQQYYIWNPCTHIFLNDKNKQNQNFIPLENFFICYFLKWLTVIEKEIK